jgi:hypothetical protein
MNRRTARIIAVVLGLLAIVFLWAGSTSPTIFFWTLPALHLIPHNYAVVAALACLVIAGLILVVGVQSGSRKEKSNSALVR